jgi:hypothetical protein
LGEICALTELSDSAAYLLDDFLGVLHGPSERTTSTERKTLIDDCGACIRRLIRKER